MYRVVINLILQEGGKSDRFYDDNLWLGLDFLDLYEQTGNDAYLASARNIWNFIESGCDSILGGGVYWCEQKKNLRIHVRMLRQQCWLYGCIH